MILDSARLIKAQVPNHGPGFPKDKANVAMARILILGVIIGSKTTKVSSMTMKRLKNHISLMKKVILRI